MVVRKRGWLSDMGIKQIKREIDFEVKQNSTENERIPENSKQNIRRVDEEVIQRINGDGQQSEFQNGQEMSDVEL